MFSPHVLSLNISAEWMNSFTFALINDREGLSSLFQREFGIYESLAFLSRRNQKRKPHLLLHTHTAFVFSARLNVGMQSKVQLRLFPQIHSRKSSFTAKAWSCLSSAIGIGHIRTFRCLFHR